MTASPGPGLFTASLPELYERYLVEPLFRPFAEALLDSARVGPGDRLLDVACGTGIVARVAAARIGDAGRVVAVDASPAMLSVARSVAPAIDFREGDAAHLPIAGDHAYDVVTCHQGLQFFADKPAAIREMRRMLAPAGRVAIGTWRSTDDVPMFRELHHAAEQHLGPIVDVRHSMGDGNVLGALLAEGGFQGTVVDTVVRTVRMSAEPDVFARLNAMAVTGMSAAAKAMSDEQRAAAVDGVIADSIKILQRHADGGGIAFEMSSNVAIARAQ